jgi:hypothetical protein
MDSKSGPDNELLPSTLRKEATIRRGGSYRLMPVSPTNDDISSNVAAMPVQDMGGKADPDEQIEQLLARIRAKNKLMVTQGARESERVREVR